MSIRQGNNIISGVTSTNYNDLSNKPQINSIELSGNKSLDDLSIQNKLTAGKNITIENNTISSTGNGRNIGDIFYTTRTDNELNGAVEANGTQYNFADVNQGQNNVQALLVSGALPSVTIAAFDAKVASDGGCDSFGYGTNELTLYPVEIYLGHSEGVQYYSNIYDWTIIEPDPNEDYILPGVKIYDKDTHEELVGYYVKHIPELGNDYWHLYNADNEFLIEAASPSYWPGGEITVPTGGEFQPTTYFKVPKKLSRVLVRTQKPTADNNYTWYNLYADGWVEQGGVRQGQSQFNFPVVMMDSNYVALATMNQAINDAQRVDSKTTTGMGVYGTQLGRGGTVAWEVKGYADPTEYTKDKWGYQNVQVERPMVQLFNGATDEAVATCTQVLSDVANLNMGDYVIYWDSADSTDHSHAKPGVPTPTDHGWYRVYKSGWVEQGGTVGNINNTCILVTLPIGMTNTSFTAIASGNTSGIAANYNGVTCDRRSSTQIAICTTGQQGNGCSWRVEGYAA